MTGLSDECGRKSLIESRVLFMGRRRRNRPTCSQAMGQGRMAEDFAKVPKLPQIVEPNTLGGGSRLISSICYSFATGNSKALSALSADFLISQCAASCTKNTRATEALVKSPSRIHPWAGAFTWPRGLRSQ